MSGRHIKPWSSERFSDIVPPEDWIEAAPSHGFDFEMTSIECSLCREGIGMQWIGTNDRGVDQLEFFPFWVDYHEKGQHLSWERDRAFAKRWYDLHCDECHEYIVSEPPAIPDRIVGEPEHDQPTVGGWIIIHGRATDTVYFGPFETLREVDEWMRNVGEDRGVRAVVIPLISPESNPANLWHDPIRTGQIKIVQPEGVDDNA